MLSNFQHESLCLIHGQGRKQNALLEILLDNVKPECLYLIYAQATTLYCT